VELFRRFTVRPCKVHGWLLVALTSEFLDWSGMASIGMFYLLLIARFVSMTTAWKLRRRRGEPFYFFAFGATSL